MTLSKHRWLSLSKRKESTRSIILRMRDKIANTAALFVNDIMKRDK